MYELLDINYWNCTKNLCLYIIFMYVYIMYCIFIQCIHILCRCILLLFIFIQYNKLNIITLITKQIKYFMVDTFMVCFTYLFETNILFLQY